MPPQEVYNFSGFQDFHEYLRRMLRGNARALPEPLGVAPLSAHPCRQLQRVPQHSLHVWECTALDVPLCLAHLLHYIPIFSTSAQRLLVRNNLHNLL